MLDSGKCFHLQDLKYTEKKINGRSWVQSVWNYRGYFGNVADECLIENLKTNNTYTRGQIETLPSCP